MRPRLSLQLDEAPLILANLYTEGEVKVKWPKQTTYATPIKLPEKVKKNYDEKMEWFLREYKTLQKQDGLKHIAPHILPYAARVDIELKTTKGSLINSIGPLKEMPTSFTVQMASSLSDSLGSSEHDTKLDIFDGGLVQHRGKVKLIKANPLNELELLNFYLYRRSSLSWHDLYDKIEKLSFEKKQNLLKDMLASSDDINTSYILELVAEPQIVTELKEKLTINNIVSQPASPAHGYDVPDVKDGGMIEKCFDMSYELYSQLQSSVPAAAPLACLYGHKQRYVIELNNKSLINLYDKSISMSAPALAIIRLIRKEISLKHQTIHDWLKNKEKSEARAQ